MTLKPFHALFLGVFIDTKNFFVHTQMCMHAHTHAHTCWYWETCLLTQLYQTSTLKLLVSLRLITKSWWWLSGQIHLHSKLHFWWLWSCCYIHVCMPRTVMKSYLLVLLCEACKWYFGSDSGCISSSGCRDYPDGCIWILHSYCCKGAHWL